MATHPISQRLFGLAAKLESAGGTPETISKSTDAIRLAEEGTLEGPLALSENRREGVVGGSLSLRPTSPGDPTGIFYRVGWRMPVIGAGSAYSASNLPIGDALLVPAALARTVTATSGSESVAYDPDDDPNTGTDDTVTIEAQTHNREYILKGGVTESLALRVTAGGIAYWEGSTVAIYDSDTELALESHTYSTVGPCQWANSGPLDVNGVTTIIGRDLVLDYGLEAAMRPAPDADGFAPIAAKITARNPTLRISAETLAKSSWDPESDYRSSTLQTIDVTIGGTQYERAKIDADGAYVDNIGRIELDGGLVGFEVTYALSEDGTNQLQVLFD